MDPKKMVVLLSRKLSLYTINLVFRKGLNMSTPSVPDQAEIVELERRYDAPREVALVVLLAPQRVGPYLAARHEAVAQVFAERRAELLAQLELPLPLQNLY